jgi:putative nucleotidyltransferase with HDIG domain
MSLPLQPARRDGGARRDLGLIAVSVAGTGAAYALAADSLALATGAPIAFSTAAGMHARLAMARWRAAAQIVASAAVLLILDAPLRLAALAAITGLAGAELIARRANRSAVLPVSVWVTVIAFLARLSAAAAAPSGPARDMLAEALAAAIGGFLGAPLMLMLAPIAERLFGHITRLTMSDWLNYEHPLLEQLASAAPGTFQHSINVGVLADAAAGAIGADPLLARVGGLYHDTGKINAPEYFVENQHGPNPHDNLDPAESARLLRAHVTDGVELVRRHRMGERLADFVREHHGTSEMRLFKEKAAALGRAPDDAAYRYGGPRPRSRETGIVMVADQLEATARAEPPADAEASDRLVRTTIERIQHEHQLGDSGLTVDDLARAGKGFSRALQAMYHRRLVYPPSDAAAPRPRLLFPRRQSGRAAS